MEELTAREVAFLLGLLDEIDKAPRPIYEPWKRRVFLRFSEGDSIDFDICRAKLRTAFSRMYSGARLKEVGNGRDRETPPVA